jgi:hypothetical protein
VIAVSKKQVRRHLVISDHANLSAEPTRHHGSSIDPRFWQFNGISAPISNRPFELFGQEIDQGANLGRRARPARKYRVHVDR